MRLSIYILLFLVIGTQNITGQVLRGSIKDSSGNPIPYSTVFVREVSLGTAANIEGNFELKLPEGSYTCVFQSLGFQPETITVKLNLQTAPLQVELANMVYNIAEVIITENKEDPAYRIIRNVIARAPVYAAMVNSYNAEVYIKGSLHIKRISTIVKLLASKELKEANIKQGDIYLEESVNVIDFKAPNVIHQKVKSIQSNFPDFGEDQSSSAIGFISGNVYKPRGFGSSISPIAPGAFNNYRFRHEGKTVLNDYTVHKIAILPRGSGSQYVKGFIYIIDGLWCVSNLDIITEGQLGVTIHLTQNYNEVRDGAWLPVSNRLHVDIDLLDNRGAFDYHTSIRYNKLSVNPTNFKKMEVKVNENLSARARAHREKTRVEIAKKQEKIDALSTKENPNTAEAYRLARLQRKQQQIKLEDSLRFSHDYVDNYVTEFDSSARVNDSVYWNNIRPIPLTGNELASSRKFKRLEEKPKRLDSLIMARESSRFSKVMFGGLIKIDSSQTIRSWGIFNPVRLRFNVVDGFRYHTGLLYEKNFKNNDVLAIQPKLGYAFSRERPYWEVLSYWKQANTNSMTGIKFGQQSFDYNRDGIKHIESTIEALIYRENPAIFYHSTYLNLFHEKELVYGLTGKAGVLFSDNTILDNNSDFSLFFNDTKEYKVNLPDNSRYRMEKHQDMSVEFVLKYQSLPFYYFKDGKKVLREGMNNTPIFSLGWRKGIKTGLFDTDYDLLKGGVEQRMRLGLMNELNYMFEAGYYVNNNVVYFSQFQHFSKRPVIAGFQDFFPYFVLLNPYRFSTDQHFISGHLHYKSPFIILKRLPILRDRLWKESLYFGYLYTPQNKNYFEPGYSIGNMLFNLGVFAGFNGYTYQEVGIRFSILIFASKEITF